MKDVPAELPPGFAHRRDPRARGSARRFRLATVFRSLKALPAGAVVGTSSLRRAAQIAERYPRLEARLLRGNVETRLAKLDRGEYDAIVLAAAGLMRLGLEARIRARLEPEDSLPAPGQGALGIECLAARTDVRRAARAARRCRRPRLRARRARGEPRARRQLHASRSAPIAELRRRANCACARWWPPPTAAASRARDVDGDAATPEALGELRGGGPAPPGRAGHPRPLSLQGKGIVVTRPRAQAAGPRAR